MMKEARYLLTCAQATLGLKLGLAAWGEGGYLVRRRYCGRGSTCLYMLTYPQEQVVIPWSYILSNSNCL